MKIRGRDPVAIVDAIQAVLLLCSLHALAWAGINTTGDVTVVVLALNGAAAVFLAATTHRPVLAHELTKPLLALAALYHFHLGTEQTGYLWPRSH